MRKFFLILLGLLVVLVVGVVVVLLTLDLNAYKPEIEAELEAATGRDVTIDGNIRVAFVPTLAISIEDVTVAGAPGGSGDPFLKLPEILAVIALSPLTSLDVVIERFRLIDPVIVLEAGTDGPASWELAPVGEDGSDSGAIPSVKIELVDFQDGRVVVRDGSSVRRFDNVDLWIEALGPDGPFEASGKFSHLGHAWTLAADIGRITRPQLAINVTLQSGEDLTARVAGTLARTNGVQGFSGQIEADLVNLGFLGQLAELPPLPDALRNAPLSFDTSVSVSSQAARLSDLSLTLGDSSATGEAMVQMNDALAVDLTLSVSKLDVDTLLAAAAMAQDDPIAVIEGGEDAQPWPDDMTLHAALTVDAAVYRGSPIRQIAFDAALADGIWTLRQAKAQLPGGTSLALSGTVGVEEGEPTFRGPVELASDNLRATLDWLDVGMDEVPQDRLRRVDLFADVVVSPSVLAMTALDLSFDSSRLTGGFAARVDDVPTLTVDVALDQLNLDAYLATGDAVEDVPDGGFSLSMEPVAFFLSLINLDLKARIASLTYNGVAVGGIQADGTLADGRLMLRSLGASDVAGAALRFSGEVDPGAGTVALQMGAKADDAGGLLRLMGIELPIDPSELGTVELVGDINGDADQAIIRQRLQTELGAASIDGTLIEPFGDLAFDGRVGLQSTSYRTLAQAVGADLPDAADSEIALAADIATDGKEADFEAILDVLGVSLRSSGSVAGLQGQPVFDLRLQADHAELARLLGDLGVDGGFPDLGPLKASLVATGSADLIDVTLAPSTLGPSTLNGTLGLYLSDEKPRIEARLNAGELAFDPFLAVLSRGTLGDATPDGTDERWSSEELDLGILEDIEAHVELAAERLLLQGMAFSRVAVVAEIAEGRLDIERFDGELFGGQMALTGQVVAGVPHQTAFDLALANADVKQILQHFAQTDAITGRLYLDFSVIGDGLSQRDIIQSLAGEGDITLRNGTLRGFDLRAINDNLAVVGDEAAVEALLARVTTQGETTVTAADGTFTVAGGVVHSGDLRVMLDGGQADFVMEADLPRWWIDMEGEARLTGHAGAPGMPIALHGQINDPDHVFDTRSLQNFLNQRAEAEAAAARAEAEAAAAAEAEAAAAQAAEAEQRRLEEEASDDAATAAEEEPSREADGVVSGAAGDPPVAVDPQAVSIEMETVVPPVAAVPEKPEPPEAPLVTVVDQEGEETASSPAATGSGGLLDLLGGAAAVEEPAAPEAPAEPAVPEAAADDNQGFDSEGLLQDLLNGLGN